MQNDMLKNNIVPWQEKGRWYQCAFKSDGSNWTIITDKTDPRLQNITVASGYFIKFGDSKLTNLVEHIIDIKVKIDSYTTTGVTLYGTYFNIYRTPNAQDIILCPANYYTGIAEVWLFIG